MFNDYPIILCASGNSIPYNENGLKPELADIITKNISMGLNYFDYYGCKTTFTSFVDPDFYTSKSNQEWLMNIPLIIGRNDNDITNTTENTILLPKSRAYFGKDSWEIKKEMCLYCKTKVEAKERLRRCPKCNSAALCSIGFYHNHFVSLFALTLSIALGFKEIYILGLDSCEINGKTHFYQDKITNFAKFRGVGKKLNGHYNTGTYNDRTKTNNWYAPYDDEKDIKFYNVSPESIIEQFPKISYEDFLVRHKPKCDLTQDEIRFQIKEFINRKVNE